MVMMENSKDKERIDGYVLKGLLETKKNYTIKTRIGKALKENKLVNLPSVIELTGESLAFDIKVEKHGILNRYIMMVDEYVEGTLVKDESLVHYGWLAINKETSIYPTKFRIFTPNGKVYSAVSLTDARFSNINKNKHLTYGLYLINGLGLFSLGITLKDHIKLSYVEGIMNKVPTLAGDFSENRYRLLIIPQQALTMETLLKYGFDKVKREGELDEQK